MKTAEKPKRKLNYEKLNDKIQKIIQGDYKKPRDPIYSGASPHHKYYNDKLALR